MLFYNQRRGLHKVTAGSWCKPLTGARNPLLNLKSGYKENDMDVTTVTQLVSNLGFPIVCVGVMFWMQNKERESHSAESERWTEVVKENTEALRDLKEVVSLLKERVTCGSKDSE